MDFSYDYCLTVLLPNMTAHDDYQEDALHTAFLEQFNTYWKAVTISTQTEPYRSACVCKIQAF